MEGNYSPVDSYFANKIALNEGEDVRNFLAKLLRSAREGHMCIPAPQDLVLPKNLFNEFLVEEEEKIYLSRNWECEKQFLHHLNRLKSQDPSIHIPLDHLSESLEREQRTAITNAATNSLSFICGGPGSGKTYTAIQLIRNFIPHMSRDVIVAAPTGKATANLRDALQGLCSVHTLHSWLQRSVLSSDLILVDEASMIDAYLMKKLFSSVPNGSRLVLVGDPHQLPPVESGNFFSVMTRDVERTTFLKKCFRSEIEDIRNIANSVRDGVLIPHSPLPSKKEFVEEVFERKACVLTPLRYGPWGVCRLNDLLMRDHKRRGCVRIPIMITVNDSQIGLYNGDVGEILGDGGFACFHGKQIPLHILPPYEQAYALSVHKSQGSEYDDVIVVLPEGAEIFGREVLYTAVTRAKRKITIYADTTVLSKILAKHEERLCGLS